MSLTLVTPPALEPVTVAEVRRQLRLESTAGEPAPTAPTVALVAAAGNITAGVHRWLWVARTADGSTEAGAVSAPLTTILATHGKATVTKPLGGSAVTFMDLYRTAAGGSTYLFVAATANDGVTYTDNVADASLGAQAPTVNTTIDPELAAMTTAARVLAEDYTGRAFLTQTWDLVADDFAAIVRDGVITLPMPPLLSVTSVSYLDASGVLQTWAASQYTVEAPTGPTAPAGRIVPVSGVTWPTTYDQAKAVTVRFVCGYGATAASVPAPLRYGVLFAVGDLYAVRANVDAPSDARVMRAVTERLLNPFRWR